LKLTHLQPEFYGSQVGMLALDGAGLPPQQQRKTLCAASESGEGVQQKQEAEEVPPQQQAMCVHVCPEWEELAMQ